jgi:acyl homoserine lactone synthase
MIQIIRGHDLADPLHAAMFADRKRVFIDLLRWDVPVVGGRFEIDQYDGEPATYIMAHDGAGCHLGSLRLLPTLGPHILGDLFADLCDDDVPRAAAIAEITRLCLPLDSAAARLGIRNALISAMVDHCREVGIKALTGVVSAAFRRQICAMGWRCAALGPARRIRGEQLGAFRIDLDADTPAQLAANGIYAPPLAGSARCAA